MKVTSKISSTSLRLYEEYEVLDTMKGIKDTHYKIKAETGKEMFVNSNKFIKGKDDE